MTPTCRCRGWRRSWPTSSSALGLEEVAVVANDTGGAVAQWLVGHHADRVGRLVLTSCDAFEKFPPTPQRYLEVAARSRALMWLVGWTVRFTFVQRLPTAYGWVTQRPIDPAIMRSYTGPIRTQAGVRRDLQRLLRAVDTRYTFEAAESLRGFDKPALVLWADGDKIFPRDHGRRLAELLPQGRFEMVSDSRTFIPEDQPGETDRRRARVPGRAAARGRLTVGSGKSRAQRGREHSSWLKDRALRATHRRLTALAEADAVTMGEPRPT